MITQTSILAGCWDGNLPLYTTTIIAPLKDELDLVVYGIPSSFSG
jgi:hypothetical protein